MKLRNDWIKLISCKVLKMKISTDTMKLFSKVDYDDGEGYMRVWNINI